MNTKVPSKDTTKETALTKFPIVILLAAICCFLWGSAFPCIKIGYQLFHIASTDTVSRVAIFGFLNPLCGVILSALLLNEKNQAFSLAGLISLVLVCLGIFIVNKGQKASTPNF